MNTTQSIFSDIASYYGISAEDAQSDTKKRCYYSFNTDPFNHTREAERAPKYLISTEDSEIRSIIKIHQDNVEKNQRLLPPLLCGSALLQTFSILAIFKLVKPDDFAKFLEKKEIKEIRFSASFLFYLAFCTTLIFHSSHLLFVLYKIKMQNVMPGEYASRIWHLSTVEKEEN